MAIKLETKSVSPSAVATLDIRSHGEGTSVILASEEHKEFMPGPSGKDEFQVNKLKRKQLCTFIGADGSAVTLEGVLPESDCVEIAAAHKVVVQIKIANELKGAFAAGKVSKGYTALDLVRVVEVWDSPKNCLWKAKDGISANPTKVFDPSTGKVTAA